MALGHVLLSDRGLDMVQHLPGVKSEGSGGKVQEEERGQRRDERKSGLLSALVLIW